MVKVKPNPGAAQAEPPADQCECERASCPHRHVRLEGPRAGGFPLCLARTGEALKVARIMGGKTIAARLAEMGLHPGAELKILCNMGGPMIVEVKGSRVSLGRGTAVKVMVE